MHRSLGAIGVVALLAMLCVSSRAFAFGVTLFSCPGDGIQQVGVSQASASGPCIYPSPVDPNQTVLNGFASASANLATGQLRASVTDINDILGTEVSAADFNDLITIVGPFPADPMESIEVTVTMHVDGSISGPPDVLQHALFQLSASNSGARPPASQIVTSLVGFDGTSVGTSGNTAIGDVSVDYLSLQADAIELLLTATIQVSSAFPTFQLYASLAVLAGDIGGQAQTVDFGSTAQLGLILPADFSSTSESGVFLTQAAPNAVPEPGTLGLLATGLVGLLCVSWRHRQRAA